MHASAIVWSQICSRHEARWRDVDPLLDVCDGQQQTCHCSAPRGAGRGEGAGGASAGRGPRRCARQVRDRRLEAVPRRSRCAGMPRLVLAPAAYTGVGHEPCPICVTCSGPGRCRALNHPLILRPCVAVQAVRPRSSRHAHRTASGSRLLARPAIAIAAASCRPSFTIATTAERNTYKPIDLRGHESSVC